MPANLTAQYLKAEEAYRRALTPEEQLECLQVMLRELPKHKGTDHLQADLKKRLSKLREEAAKPRGKKSFDPFRIEKGGAGQVLLLGAPNCGKSAIVANTTTKARSTQGAASSGTAAANKQRLAELENLMDAVSRSQAVIEFEPDGTITLG